MRTKNMKYTRINISSARKNPALNPKVSVIENLRPYSKNSRAFITFTNINKVGVNPQSNFSTPLGIYAYPLRAFWEDIENDKIPYAGDRPYVSLLLVKRNAKILNNNYSYNDLDQDLLKLYKFCEEKKLVESNREFVRLKDDAYEKYSFESTKPVFYIWAITRYIAFLLTLSGEDNINHITKWSSIFNKVLGYDGAIDFRGWGFIHPNEPKQAVFFSIKAFSDTKTFLNRRYEERRKGINNKNFKYTKFMIDHDMVDEVFKLNPSLNKKTFYAEEIIARPVNFDGEVKVAIVSGGIGKGSIISDCILGEPHNINNTVYNHNPTYYPQLHVGLDGNSDKRVKLINCKIISSPGYYTNTEFRNCVIDGGYINTGTSNGEKPCIFIDCDFKRSSSKFKIKGFPFAYIFDYRIKPDAVQEIIDQFFADKKDITDDEIQEILKTLEEKTKATKINLLVNKEGINKVLSGISPFRSLFKKK